jgi:DNA-binding MarR family transcriptional regulator
MLFPQDQLVHVVQLAANIWMATRTHLETRLRPLSMTWPQFGMLLALDQGDSLTQRELGEALETDRTTVSVICDSLEKHGWAERRPDPSDRRVKRVCLTEAGRAAIAEAQGIVWGVYGTIADVLTPEEIAEVVPKLERVFAAIKAVPTAGEPSLSPAAIVAGADGEVCS